MTALAAGVAGLLLALGAGPVPPPAAMGAPPAAGVTPPAAVVVVGVPGLRWDHVDARSTPTLWRLAGKGGVGALSVTGARPVTCPVDGWLTLGAGNRARGPAPAGGECAALPSAPDGTASGPAELADFASLARDNDRLRYGTELGGLAGALRAAGGCLAAAGPGAPLAAAGPEGKVDVVTSGLGFAATYTRCTVTLVGLPPVSGDPATVTAADTVLAAVDGARPPGSELLVVGLAETSPRQARLHVAIALGPGYDGGLLTSASTRRAPYVQLVDVAPTVLRDLGRVRPEAMVGQPWLTTGGRSGDPAGRVAALVDADRAAAESLRLVAPFFEVLVAGQLLLFPVAGLAIRRQPPGAGRDRMRRLLRLAGLAGAALLVATFLANLVPWWRAGHPLAALVVALAVADAAVVTLALAGPWRRHPLGPPAAVAGVTAAVLALDLLTGARLQISSLAGYSPLVAGRFAGLGNIAFGVFATAALFLATALATGRSRRTALWTVTGVGAVAVLVDGAPSLGSDFGGVLALVPAFALLAMLLAGIRVTWLRLVGAGGAGALLVAAFALLDYARPADRQTHLGRFVGQLLHGDAGTVVRRKAVAEATTLTTSLLTLLVPVAVAIVVWALARPPGWLRATFARAPALRAGLVATVLMGVVAALVNDSGVIIPAVAMTVAIPLTLAVSAAAPGRPGVTVEFRGRADRPAQQTH